MRPRGDAGHCAPAHDRGHRIAAETQLVAASMLHSVTAMSRLRLSCLAIIVTAFACGGAPKPEARLASSEGAIRGAQEAGAAQVPQATLHLKLAQEQRDEAVKLIKDGDNHRAAMLLARAEADAELAVALARQANAGMEASKAQESVEALKAKETP